MILTLWLLACLGAEPSRTVAAPLPTPEPVVSEPLLLHIRSPADAAGATAAVMQLVYGTEPLRPVQLVIHGEHSGLHLSLGGSLDPRRVDLSVRGEGAVLRQSTLELSGQTLRVEGLRFVGPQRAVLFQASTRLDLNSVQILQVPASSTAGAGSRALGGFRLRALAPDVQASLRDLRLLDNAASPLLRWEAEPGASFARVDLIDCRLGGNLAPELLVGPVLIVETRGCQRVGEGSWLQTESATTLLLDEPQPVAAEELSRWRAGG
jgi:hypothetical protein